MKVEASFAAYNGLSILRKEGSDSFINISAHSIRQLEVWFKRKSVGA